MLKNETFLTSFDDISGKLRFHAFLQHVGVDWRMLMNMAHAKTPGLSDFRIFWTLDMSNYDF